MFFDPSSGGMLKFQSSLIAIVLGSVLFLSTAGAGVAADAGIKTLHGHVPAAVAGFHLQPLGRLPATQQLRLAIGLPLHNGAGLDNFLAQVYDPASPNFRQFLTQEEFTARFGPTEQDYETVKNFAQTNGLTVTTTYGNRLVLDVTGPAASVEKAFHITLRTYRHPTEARDFFAPDVEPTVDATLPVVDIQGLSDFSRPHPRLHRIDAATAANAIPKNGSAPNGSGNYFGNDFRNAYAPGVTLTGTGQMVGLLEFDGFYSSDITAYATAAGNGRTNIVIQTVLLDGYNGVPTTGSDSGNPEVSLDIEMAMDMAPGLAKIVVFEAGPSGSQNDVLESMLGSSNTVKNLSSSWGWSGGPSTTTGSIFTNMAAVGQSFFNAAGDSDAFTTGASSVNGVDNPSLDNEPSSCPIITQVGGTTLTTGANAVYSSETVWNWGGGTGTSGGISSTYSIPSWQTNVSNMTGRGGSATQRNIPDVALTADNVFVDYGNGTNGDFGGTSCAAPLWAGFMALANQQAVANGKSPVGFINPAIYTIAAGASYASCFYDVTTGNNFWSSSPSLFYATNGYDLCTGLGTPAGQGLINALTISDALIISPLFGTATGVAGGPFSITSGNFLLTNTSSSSLTWSLVNTSAWFNISATSGTLAAAAQASLTCSITPAAGNLAVGTYTANLTFSNWTSHVVQIRLFTLQVTQPMVVSPTYGFAASGLVGGAFSVTSQNFLLSNQGGSSLPWGIINTSSWLNASPSSGTLAGGAQTTVTVSLTAAANSLASGIYTANVVVTNSTGVAASLPFTINVGDQSLVQNGGFETGDFTGWTLNGSSSYNFVTTDSTISGVVHSGSYGAALGQYSSLGYLYQTLTTSPGQNYLLSLWLDNPNNSIGATPNQFLVQWNGATVFNQSNIPFISWTNLQFIVTATSASTVLQFGFEDTPWYLCLDDISVVPIPLPTFKTTVQMGSAFNLTFGTVTGLVYQLQYKTNLVQPTWINLGKPLFATGSTLTVSDTNAFNLSPQRFYRLQMSQ
jgi:subtilase family serine protease